MRVGEVGGNTLGLYGGMFAPDGKSIIAHGYQGAFHQWSHDEVWTNHLISFCFVCCYLYSFNVQYYDYQSERLIMMVITIAKFYHIPVLLLDINRDFGNCLWSSLIENDRNYYKRYLLSNLNLGEDFPCIHIVFCQFIPMLKFFTALGCSIYHESSPWTNQRFPLCC